MSDPTEPLRAVHLFVDNPIDFEGLWVRSDLVDWSGISVRIASMGNLMQNRWQVGSKDRLALGRAATPAQRMRWLEEMIVLAHRTGALPRPPDR